MKSWFGRLVAGAVVNLLLTSIAAAAPLAVYGRLPRVEQIEIAPDGAHLALVLTDGEARQVVIQRVADKKLIQRIPVGETKVRDIAWGGSRRLIITSTKTQKLESIGAPRFDWATAVIFDIETTRVYPLMDDVAGLTALFAPPEVREIDGKPFAFVRGASFPGDYAALTVFKIDLTNRQATTIFTGGQFTRQVLLDGRGEAVAQTAYEDRPGRWTLKFKSDGVWREIATSKDFWIAPILRGLGRDGVSALVEDETEDRYSLREVPFADPSKSALLIDGSAKLLFSPADGRLVGYRRLNGDVADFKLFPPGDDRIWRGISAAFPGDLIELESWSADRNRIVVRVDSAKEGAAYVLVDRAAGTADWLSLEYRDVTAAEVSPKRSIRFTAADGLPLTGYLTLPRGRPEKGLPLIVFPHAEMSGRDEPGFDWWAQAMASRGYAVLQVNFRGSGGLGSPLTFAGFGELGRRMQTDLSDGVRYLASEGMVDASRVCIVGASYGGYAALAGAAFEPGVYRCAASVGGISDLKRNALSVRGYRGVLGQRYWFRFMGVEDENDPTVAERSPLGHASQIHIPVLLVHGKDDTIVPMEQSQLMAKALRNAGQPVELVVLPGEDHWLTTGVTRQAMLTSVVSFVEKHNPPN